MPTYFLDPNADVKAGWAEVPAGTAFSTVDDGLRQPTVPTGTDWIASSTSTDNCTLGLTTFTVPANETITAVTAWAYTTVVSTNHQIGLSLVSSAGTTGSSTPTICTTNGWHANVWNDRSFSQTELDGLQIQMVLTEWATELGVSTVACCYVEVTTVSNTGPYYTEVMALTPSLYWRMNDLGSTVTDYSGNARTGTFNGSVTKNQPSLVPSEPASGSLFIDISTPISGVTANAYKPYAVGSSRTFSCWMKPLDRTAARGGHGAPTIFAGDGTTGAAPSTPHPTWELIADGRVRMYSTVNTFPVNFADITNGTSMGQTIHFVSTFNDATGRREDFVNGRSMGVKTKGDDIYLNDGTLVFTGFPQHYDTGADPGHFTVGYRGNPGSGNAETFAGYIDEVAIFERILTAQEVLDLYNAGGVPATPIPAVGTGESAKPPLELVAQITTEGGYRTDWGGDKRGQDRMIGVNFTTGRGDGFKTMTLTLRRRIDRDYPDLNLYDNITLYGGDGSVAWEGRVQGMPREVSDGTQITVECVGWMAHAKDARFREIYVHRDLSAWVSASASLREYWITGNLAPLDGSVIPDNSGLPCLQMDIEGRWGAPDLPLVSAWFDSSGITIGSLYYAWRKSLTIDTSHLDWQWSAILMDGDTVAALAGTPPPITPTDSTGNLLGTGPGTGTLYATSTAHTHAGIFFGNPSDLGTEASSAQHFTINWNVLAVYGNHHLPRQGTGTATDAPGFTASQIMQDIIQRFCPQLNGRGITPTTLILPHVAFMEPTTPADAFLALNASHNWGLEVWEDRTLWFTPVDLTIANWHVRADDRNVTLDLQGDSTDDVSNGVVVTYTGFDGKTHVLAPDTHPELLSTDPNLAATQHGIQSWTDITVPFPTTQAVALSVGAAALKEFNRPKAPGTITIHGHCRDSRDSWQQVWKLRAGQSIAITDLTNDTPRLITETSYDHDSATITVTVDGTARTLDAFFERITGALTARGLS